MTRFRAILWALPLLVAGCRGQPPGAALTIAFDAEPQSADPRFGIDAASSRLADLIHVSLTRPAGGGRRAGDLAERWEWSDDRTVTFHLRRDLRFGDGTPVTAQDVRATLDAVRDPTIGSPRRATLATVAAIDAPDDATVVVRLAAAGAGFLEASGVGILPATAARDPAPSQLGAGRFRIRRIDPGEAIWLEPNPHAPDGPPALSSIAIRIVPDPVVRALELRRGTIGFVQETPEPEVLSWLATTPGLSVQHVPGTSFGYLLPNCRDPRLGKRRVRQAIAHAIDRDAIARYLLGGTVRVASGLLSPEHWAFAAARPPRYAPRRARRLLDRAGYPDPDDDGPLPRFRVILKTSSQPLRRRLAEAIQAQLAAVGIAVDLRTYEWGTLFADLRTGNFELAMSAWVGVDDPNLYFETLHSTMDPPDGYNRGHYASRVMDRLTAQGRRTADVEARRRVYARVQRRAAVDLPSLPLWWEDRIVIHRADLRDFVPDPSGNLRSLGDARIAP